MIQDEISSIARFCYNQHRVKLYYNRIPQNMVTPCMYFPEPIVTSSPDTLYTYFNAYQLFVKVFSETTQTAQRTAHTIAEAIRKAKGVIPIIDPDGSMSGKFMNVSLDIQTKELDDGVAQLSLKWKTRYCYDRETQALMGSLKIIGHIKER